MDVEPKIGVFSKGNGTPYFREMGPLILGKSMLVKYYFICLDMDVSKIGVFTLQNGWWI